MTHAHDELLFIINSEQYMKSRTPQTPYLALRAVVELHKPQLDTVSNLIGKVCHPCRTNYPCKTIKAIEKELR